MMDEAKPEESVKSERGERSRRENLTRSFRLREVADLRQRALVVDMSGRVVSCWIALSAATAPIGEMFFERLATFDPRRMTVSTVMVYLFSFFTIQTFLSFIWLSDRIRTKHQLLDSSYKFLKHASSGKEEDRFVRYAKPEALTALLNFEPAYWLTVTAFITVFRAFVWVNLGSRD